MATDTPRKIRPRVRLIPNSKEVGKKIQSFPGIALAISRRLVEILLFGHPGLIGVLNSP